jgi:hypothetical protein
VPDQKPTHSNNNSPLDHIVDDESARAQCSEWALDEIASGRSPEEVAADLVANGWAQHDAEEICEAARRQTRSRRGVASRQEVASAFGANDPNVIRDAINPSKFGALGNFFRAITRMRSTKDIGKRK